MIIINNLQENLKLFEALASPVRLKILNLLHDGNEMNINELAKKLELTNSALTMHIQKLSDCGIVRVRLAPFSRGTQKLCSLTEDNLLISLIDKTSNENFYETELDVGQYSEYSVNPTCGLADTASLIGNLDDPQVFSYSERFNAHITWYTDGYLTYRFPYKLLFHQKPKELQFTLEVSSESPGANSNFPSAIHFIVNGTDVGVYVCPGEYFERKGRYTPDWWFVNFGQYGRMKMLSVNEEGTFLDGLYLGSTTIDDLQLKNHENISFSVDCRNPDSSLNGGVTLFGIGFGDYNQGIRCRLFYTEEKG